MVNTVKELTLQGETYYLCPLCDTPYTEWEWAQRCEDFCARYNACSLDIIEHAVSLPQS